MYPFHTSPPIIDDDEICLVDQPKYDPCDDNEDLVDQEELSPSPISHIQKPTNPKDCSIASFPTTLIMIKMPMLGTS